MDWINLWADENIRAQEGRPAVLPMLLNEPGTHPAVLVIPGGGYGCVCETTEGSPVAREFNKLGYHAFVLNYRTAPARWPAPQQDAMRAMKLIRANADKWRVNADQVAVCGFSAGGHLAGSLGILCGDVNAAVGDEADGFSHIPDVMILCYGVLSLSPWSHLGTRDNLLGEDGASCWQDYSLPENVSPQTPPAFLVHTVKDTLVPFRNSIRFAEAMADAGVPCELQLCNWGDHGMLLGRNTLDMSTWCERAHCFMQTLQKMKTDETYISRYTNAYQSMQLEY